MSASGTSQIAYRVLDSPIGTLLAAATAAGLVRVTLPGEDHDRVLESLGEALHARPKASPQPLDHVSREVAEYFAGTRTQFDVPLDLSLARGFRRAVLTELRAVGYGKTVSYGELASLAGNPRASRAAGSACATNPLPIVIPCHRVVRSDGGLGGYGGGLEVKRYLLDLEQRPGR